MNIQMMFLLLLLVHSSLAFDEIFQIDSGKDVIFSCLFANEYQFNEVSFVYQTTGEILSFGLELFVQTNRLKLSLFSSNRLDLKIISVHQNDSGLYSCFNHHDELSSFILQVLIPPEFVWYYPREASLSYPEGSSLNLSCRAFAIPSVNITWICRDEHQQTKIIHVGEDISISSLKWSSSGLYECVASNGYHSTINRSFYVTIQYSPRLIKHRLIEHNDKSMEFLCEICSMPLSNIHWIKNDRIISDNSHLQIQSNVHHQQCLITQLFLQVNLNVDWKDLEYEKSGRYECRAENSLGHHSHHFDYYPKRSYSHLEKDYFITSFENPSYRTLENQTNSSKCLCPIPSILIYFLLLLNL